MVATSDGLAGFLPISAFHKVPLHTASMLTITLHYTAEAVTGRSVWQLPSSTLRFGRLEMPDDAGVPPLTAPLASSVVSSWYRRVGILQDELFSNWSHGSCWGWDGAIGVRFSSVKWLKGDDVSIGWSSLSWLLRGRSDSETTTNCE